MYIFHNCNEGMFEFFDTDVVCWIEPSPYQEGEDTPFWRKVTCTDSSRVGVVLKALVLRSVSTNTTTRFSFQW